MRIIRRDEWEARAPRSRQTILLPTPDLYLHHSVTSQYGAKGVRSIQRMHMHDRGFSDIGYSFIYDPKHREWYEGRGAGVRGAHTEGHNSRSHGLAVIGNFETDKPDERTLSDIARMVSHGHEQGWWAKPALTGGHRDTKATACPGKHLYKGIDRINYMAGDNELFVAAPTKIAGVEVIEQQIKQYYRDILGHEADAEGLAFWAAKIVNGEMNMTELAIHFLVVANGSLRKQIDAITVSSGVSPAEAAAVAERVFYDELQQILDAQ